jgi:hypothetical protein
MKTFNDFDVSSLVFSGLRKNTKGGKMVYVNLAGGVKAHFELPTLRSPFGLSSYTDQNSGNVSYSLDLSLEDPIVAEKVKQIESVVLEHVVKNSEELLGKKYNEDVIRQALFKSCIRDSKDGKYAPTMKLKIMMRDGKFVPEAYDSSRCMTTLDTLQKGQRVKTIVDFNQIWIIDNKFGLSVRLLQAMLFPTSELKGCAFGDDFVDQLVNEEEDEAE